VSPIIEILLVVLGAVTAIIVLISVIKLHPAVALALVSIITGWVLGIAWNDTLLAMWNGFYNVVLGIGFVILLGSVLGTLMEQTGALKALTEMVLKVFGRNRPITALSVLGFVVGIPVFCDSGFVILSKVAKKVAEDRAVKRGMTSLALAGGLYTTHTLIPPTPGPVAAAGNMNVADQLGVIIIIGLLVSIPVLLMLIVMSNKLYSKAHASLEEDIISKPGRVNSKLLFPILLAILLIASGSLLQFTGKESILAEVITFISDPAVALVIACFIAFVQLSKTQNRGSLIVTGAKQSLPIILITGTGGAFGQVLKQSALSQTLANTFAQDGSGSAISLLLIAYVMAVIIKSAQGSSTAAIVITSSILFPLTAGYDLSIWQIAVIISTIGVGAMAVSHANDSFFWVVTRFSEMSVKEGYSKYSLLTLILSITGLGSCLLLFLAFTF